ncbi:hypothetical protein [Sphingobacterium corticis]|uniref:hypothetical protein n=1 Tax=Sphingobacterium corticis TaxID=1812823 RepID=UPI0036D2A1B8
MHKIWFAQQMVVKDVKKNFFNFEISNGMIFFVAILSLSLPEKEISNSFILSDVLAKKILKSVIDQEG